MSRQIRFAPTEDGSDLRLQLTDIKGEALGLPYGWSIDLGESALVIQFTTRQDGQTGWRVDLASPDASIQSRYGFSRTGMQTCLDIEYAIQRLTCMWLAEHRINERERGF